MRRGLGLALGLLVAVGGEAPAAFERAPTSARDAALGGGRAAASAAAFGNPASLGVRNRGDARAELTIGYPFGLPGVREEQASVKWSGERWASAGGYRAFGYDAYSEQELRLVVARQLPGGARLGAALRGLAVTGLGFSPRRSAAVDVGFQLRTDELRWSVLLEAVVGDLPGDLETEGAHTVIAVERVFRAGRIVAEVGKAGDREESYVLAGGAWHLLPILTLRAGVHPARATWAVGAGVQIFPTGLDVTYEGGHELGATVRLGLRWITAGLGEE